MPKVYYDTIGSLGPTIPGSKLFRVVYIFSSLLDSIAMLGYVGMVVLDSCY